MNSHVTCSLEENRRKQTSFDIRDFEIDIIHELDFDRRETG